MWAHMFSFALLCLSCVLHACVSVCVRVCACRWVCVPGLPLFFSNGEHVVITVIYHSDGLALPATVRAEAATA